ncbi:MAG: hypothetical protein LC751_16725 [Actinobacteria bacterium]|nr:hypothetical protein [Actinomycetota bacterium]
MGYEDVKEYSGGKQYWTTADLPTESGASENGGKEGMPPTISPGASPEKATPLSAVDLFAGSPPSTRPSIKMHYQNL